MGLTMEQIVDFHTQGYLIAENIFTEAELQSVIDEISAVIDEKAKALHAAGSIADLHEDAPFERRIALLAAQSRDITAGIDIMDTLGPAMFAFLKHDKLLDVVQCLLGRELECNPIQHVRAKLPWSGEGEQPMFENVPWHQDVAVTTVDSDASEIITFWLPLVDATAETGCMEVIPEVFKFGYLEHQKEGGTTIVPQLLPHVKPIAAECRKGGMVIMSKYTPHRGIPNRSDKVRWSLDLRYHRTGAASGRSFQPSHVVRSAVHPDSVLSDHGEWAQSWREALAKPNPRVLHRV